MMGLFLIIFWGYALVASILFAFLISEDCEKLDAITPAIFWPVIVILLPIIIVAAVVEE